jgi:hypothetical protein
MRPGRLIIGASALFAALTLFFSAAPSPAASVATCLLFGPPAALRDVSKCLILCRYFTFA